MNAILYSTLAAAQTALAKCNDIAQGDVEQIGEGVFADAQPPRPYTWILTHPDGSKWALVADSKVEARLKKTAIELPADWFQSAETVSVPNPPTAPDANG